MYRPRPPAELTQGLIEVHGFVPSPELRDWAFATFIDEGAPLENPEHRHLQSARIGFLWAGVGNSRHGRAIVGQCEKMPPHVMGKWAKARAEQQIAEWFGRDELDFLITLDARYADQASDAEFCALVEHELMHAGQERDLFGMPKFTELGRPKYGMRGHDVEEFVSIVRRYGAVTPDLKALVDAAQRAPEVAAISVSQVCGTCLLRVA